jgi:hypothetical protein
VTIVTKSLIPFPNGGQISDTLFVASPPNQVTHSRGSQLLITVPAETITGRSPSAPQPGNITGFSAFACLGFASSNPGYGVLGKLIAGLVTAGYPSGQQAPFTQLPSDASLLTTLYDGSAADALLPPTPNPNDGTDTSHLLQLSGETSFPIPVPITPGLCAGLWLTPSLIGCYANGSIGALYTLNASITLFHET